MRIGAAGRVSCRFPGIRAGVFVARMQRVRSLAILISFAVGVAV